MNTPESLSILNEYLSLVPECSFLLAALQTPLSLLCLLFSALLAPPYGLQAVVAVNESYGLLSD